MPRPQFFVLSFASLAALTACGSELDTDHPARAEPRGILDPNRCPGTFAECDGDPATVCETDLASSPTHCGACGHACPEGLFCSSRGCILGNEVGQVVALAYATCVRKGSGEVYCWGLNDDGQLGEGTKENRIAPTRVHVDGVAEIFGDARSMCARRLDGTAACWGSFWSPGPLTGDTESDVLEPESVHGLGSVAVLLPWWDCAVNTSGAVLCWGHNECGAFGNGTTGQGYVDHPVASFVQDAASIAGGYATCVAQRDGRVSCWGIWRGLGDGSQETTTSSDAPFCDRDGSERGEGLRIVPGVVPGIDDAISVAPTGNGGICAVLASGLVSCWGDVLEDHGSSGPVPRDLVPQVVDGLHDVFKIGVGRFHGCALLRDGTVSCWGRNNSDGLTLRGGAIENPGFVPKLNHVVDIAVGSEHTCALRDTGELWCWGVNHFGELGDGTTNFSATPVRVIGLE